MDYKIFATADNAEAQLDSGISASTLSIPLKTGEGSLLPEALNGNATSAGSGVLLNATGIGLTVVQVGDFIYNLTDGSHCFVTAKTENTLSTTQLIGGSDNAWQNGDEYVINPFIVTLNKRTNGVITASEKVLIKKRVGDFLTAETRGFDGDTPQPFDADDFVNLFAVSMMFEGVKQSISEAHQRIESKAEIAYVDALIQARKFKDNVRLATTVAGDLASDFEEGMTIDGQTLVEGYRFLIKNQADPKENGIYTVNASGAPTRATDFDEDSEVTGSAVAVMEGTSNADSIWLCTSDNPEIGTDNIEFVKIYPQTSFSGLTKDFVLGENINIGDPCRLINDSGTPKAKRTYERDLDTLTMQTEAVFFANYSNYRGAVWINTNKVAIVWQDPSAQPIKVIVGTYARATNTWTFGSVVTILSGSGGDFCHIEKVATDKFVVAYRNGNDSNNPYATVCTVSGTTITAGSNTEIYNGNGLIQNICNLEDNKVVFAYYDTSTNHYRLRVATISGTTLTFGVELDFFTASSPYTFKLAKLATDKFSVFYNNNGSSYNIFNCTVSGTTITSYKVNEVVVVSSVSDSRIASTAVGTDKIITTYTSGSNICARIVTFEGNTPSCQAEVTIKSGYAFYGSPYFSILGNNEIVLFYRINATNKNNFVVLFVAGGTITVKTVNSAIANFENDTYIGINGSSGDSTLVGATNSNLTNNGSIISAIFLSVDVYDDDFFMIANESGSTGETKEFLLPGAISENHSGLTPSAKQYIDEASGEITETAQTVCIGKAISTTEIMIFPNNV